LPLKSILLLVVFLCLAATASAQSGFSDADVPLVMPTPAAVKKADEAKPSKDDGGRPAAARLKATGRFSGRGTEAGRPWTTGDAGLDALVGESARRNGIDPYLIYSVMHRESGFNGRAVSPKGARGLMQLMPGTAARFGVRDVYDPAQNIEGGAKYLRFLINMFGDERLDLVLAAYNAGENNVLRYGRSVPPFAETISYVSYITRMYGGTYHRKPDDGGEAKAGGVE
jgi:soluble lytic murein transglycosylase-like protein